jgi:hypothetical protein
MVIERHPSLCRPLKRSNGTTVEAKRSNYEWFYLVYTSCKLLFVRICGFEFMKAVKIKFIQNENKSSSSKMMNDILGNCFCACMEVTCFQWELGKRGRKREPVVKILTHSSAHDLCNKPLMNILPCPRATFTLNKHVNAFDSRCV